MSEESKELLKESIEQNDYQPLSPVDNTPFEDKTLNEQRFEKSMDYNHMNVI